MGEVEHGKLTAGISLIRGTVDTNYNRDEVVLNRDAERTTVTSVFGAFEYGITQNLGLSMSTAYSRVRHAFLSNGGVSEAAGLSDVNAGLFYDLTGDTELTLDETQFLVFSPYIGVRAPLGNFGGENVHGGHYGALNSGTGEDIRSSNGTWGLVVGTSTIFNFDNGLSSALHVFAAPEFFANANEYQPGSTASVTINLFTRPYNYANLSLIPMLSLDYGYIMQSRREGYSIMNSGGHDLSVTPQLTVGWTPGGDYESNGRWTLGLQVPLTLYAYKYGSDYYAFEGQLVQTWGLSLALNLERDFIAAQ